jgi:hypothetical protein
MQSTARVAVPYVLAIVAQRVTTRPEFLLRDPTGTMRAITTDSRVHDGLVAGTAVKLVNVRPSSFHPCLEQRYYNTVLLVAIYYPLL